MFVNSLTDYVLLLIDMFIKPKQTVRRYIDNTDNYEHNISPVTFFLINLILIELFDFILHENQSGVLEKATVLLLKVPVFGEININYFLEPLSYCVGLSLCAVVLSKILEIDRNKIQTLFALGSGMLFVLKTFVSLILYFALLWMLMYDNNFYFTMWNVMNNYSEFLPNLNAILFYIEKLISAGIIQSVICSLGYLMYLFVLFSAIEYEWRRSIKKVFIIFACIIGTLSGSICLSTIKLELLAVELRVVQLDIEDIQDLALKKQSDINVALINTRRKLNPCYTYNVLRTDLYDYNLDVDLDEYAKAYFELYKEFTLPAKERLVIYKKYLILKHFQWLSENLKAEKQTVMFAVTKNDDFVHKCIDEAGKKFLNVEEIDRLHGLQNQVDEEMKKNKIGVVLYIENVFRKYNTYDALLAVLNLIKIYP